MAAEHLFGWLELVLRWVHVVTAIAWVGASFYFNWLLNRLQAPRPADADTLGELWAIHAGGLFRVQKRRLNGGPMPEPLHWFKWEAYWTWLSGFSLLLLVYYVGAERHLIDPAVADLSPTTAILIGLGVLAGGWLCYDLAWRSSLARRPRLLGALCCLALVVTAWGLCQIFSGRGAYIHVGALLGTLMVGNVYRVIMPSQRQMVAAAERAEAPDAGLGQAAGQRSLHNNYITLPVVFVMLSSHYPATFGHEHNWLILLALFGVSVLVRHYFNLRWRRGDLAPAWMLLVALAGVVGIAAVTLPERARPGHAVPPLAQVQAIVAERCQPCHAIHPTHPAFPVPPRGLVLETEGQIRLHAAAIHAQSVLSRAMPVGNLTAMTDDERAVLGRWYAAQAADGRR